MESTGGGGGNDEGDVDDSDGSQDIDDSGE